MNRLKRFLINIRNGINFLGIKVIIVTGLYDFLIYNWKKSKSGISWHFIKKEGL